jgi:phasin
MTETTTKPRTAKNAGSSFDMPDYGMPKFEAPKFDLPKMEVPQALHEMAAKSVEQTRDAFAKAKVASEEAAATLENAYQAAAGRVTNYNLKLFEIARINTRAAFDYAQELLVVKSPTEFFELSTAHMRKQFETLSTQSRDLGALAKEAATEVGDAIKTGVAKAPKAT